MIYLGNKGNVFSNKRNNDRFAILNQLNIAE